MCRLSPLAALRLKLPEKTDKQAEHSVFRSFLPSPAHELSRTARIPAMTLYRRWEPDEDKKFTLRSTRRAGPGGHTRIQPAASSIAKAGGRWQIWLIAATRSWRRYRPLCPLSRAIKK